MIQKHLKEKLKKFSTNYPLKTKLLILFLLEKELESSNLLLVQENQNKHLHLS